MVNPGAALNSTSSENSLPEEGKAFRTRAVSVLLAGFISAGVGIISST
jgi:hypothetical protein